MFSFTWLFRIWSKNHSNFNRLWISPSFFFYCKKRFAIDFRQIAFRYPKRNIRDCLIRELLKNEINAAEHQHHCSPCSLQTDKFSGLCFFQIWCPNDVWRLLQWTWFILSSFWIWSGSQTFLGFIQDNLFTHQECWNQSCAQNIWPVSVITLYSNHQKNKKNADKM